MSTRNTVFSSAKDYLAEVRKLAEAEGKGALSAPEFVVNTAIAAIEGYVVADDKGKQDGQVSVKDAWSAFEEKVSAKLAPVGVVRTKSEDAFNTRVSELRQVVHAALKNDEFPSLLSNSRPIIAALKAEGRFTGNTRDGFIKIARAQKESDAPLSDDEVRGALTATKAKPDRTERLELEKQLKALRVIHDGTEGTDKSPPKQAYPSEELAAAIAEIERRIAVLTLAESAAPAAASVPAAIATLVAEYGEAA